MKRRTLRVTVVCVVLCLAAVGLSGCTPVRGSGQIVTETREIGDVSNVELSGIGRLEIKQGSSAALTVQADDNLQQFIQTETNGDTLVISVGPKEGRIVALMPTKTIVYTLTVPSLERINLTGSGEIVGTGLASGPSEVQISGSGRVDLTEVKSSEFTCQISGSGRATVSGEVRDETVGISGSGRLDAGDLEAAAVSLDISGSGAATVWATDTLDANISGSGSVRYYGTPTVDRNVSGSGSVRSLGTK